MKLESLDNNKENSGENSEENSGEISREIILIIDIIDYDNTTSIALIFDFL